MYFPVSNVNNVSFNFFIVTGAMRGVNSLVYHGGDQREFYQSVKKCRAGEMQQIRQIYFPIWTNTFHNLNKYDCDDSSEYVVVTRENFFNQ